MGRGERIKGRKGEREVAAMFETAGFEVRGLERSGDHLIVCDEQAGLVVHSETKRTETARPWAWWAQATADLEPGAIAVVSFRRSRSEWLAMLSLGELVRVLRELRDCRRALDSCHAKIAAYERAGAGDGELDDAELG